MVPRIAPISFSLTVMGTLNYLFAERLAVQSSKPKLVIREADPIDPVGCSKQPLQFGGRIVSLIPLLGYPMHRRAKGCADLICRESCYLAYPQQRRCEL